MRQRWICRQADPAQHTTPALGRQPQCRPQGRLASRRVIPLFTLPRSFEFPALRQLPRCHPWQAFASRSLSAIRFALYSNLALIPARFVQDRDSCTGAMPLAPTHAEISAVRFPLLLRCLDVTLIIEPRFPGASPGFHPREGGKAVRLRVQARFGHSQGSSSPSASPLRGLQQLHQSHPVTGALPG